MGPSGKVPSPNLWARPLESETLPHSPSLNLLQSCQTSRGFQEVPCFLLPPGSYSHHPVNFHLLWTTMQISEAKTHHFKYSQEPISSSLRPPCPLQVENGDQADGATKKAGSLEPGAWSTAALAVVGGSHCCLLCANPTGQWRTGLSGRSRRTPWRK